MIKIDDLSKRYGSSIALDRVSIEIKEGEIFGLLGPNGSGKTTLINCLLALLSFEHGSISIMGREMDPDAYEIKRQIGLVPQELAYFADLTVEENIRYFCGLYESNRRKLASLTAEALAFCGLEEHKKKLPRKLSGGLKRRLNIACGIAHKPKILLLDEPTVAVDAQSRHFILEGIRKMNESGVTVIYTTHYLEEVEQLCDRIVILDRGRIQAEGSLEQLLNMIKTKEKVFLKAMDLDAEDIAALKQLEGLDAFEIKEQEGHYKLSFSHVHSLGSLVSLLQARGRRYEEIYSERPGLDEVFLELTGEELRDQ